VQENLLISLDDQLLLIDTQDSKEIRDSTIEDASDKIIVFNQSLANLPNIDDIYETQYFKVRQLSLDGKNFSVHKFS
jgi:hypothetical protein